MSPRQVGNATVLDVEGSLTLTDGTRELRRCVEGLLEQDQSRLVLNLERVPYVDSAGLGALVGSFTKAKSFGGRLCLLNVQPRVLDLLRVTELDRVFSLYQAEADALASFS